MTYMLTRIGGPVIDTPEETPGPNSLTMSHEEAAEFMRLNDAGLLDHARSSLLATYSARYPPGFDIYE